MHYLAHYFQLACRPRPVFVPYNEPAQQYPYDRKLFAGCIDGSRKKVGFRTNVRCAGGEKASGLGRRAHTPCGAAAAFPGAVTAPPGPDGKPRTHDRLFIPRQLRYQRNERESLGGIVGRGCGRVARRRRCSATVLHDQRQLARPKGNAHRTTLGVCSLFFPMRSDRRASRRFTRLFG